MIHPPSLLLDPQLLASIADLEMVARVTVDGSISGLHRSPFHGYSAEFSQYRHYRPGDDLKHVDWKLLARTDRIYTRQYRETTNMPAHIVLDASASMGYCPRSGVSKLDYARLLAAALSRLIGMQGDAVGLVVHDDLVRQFMPSRTGPTHLRSLMLALTRVRASGATAASSAVRRAVELMKRRGLLLILSDLYDESAEMESELRRAVRIGHEVAVFQVLTRDEVEFPFSGDVEVEDVESGRTLVTNGDAARPAYRQRMQAFLDRWHSRCAAHRIDYTRVITDMPLDRALRGYLVRRRANPAP